MKHIVFAVILAVSLAGIAWNSWKLIKYLRIGRDENRFDNVGQRILNVLKVAIGQSKLLREPIAGLVHALIFWGFLVLLAAVVESIVEGLIPGGNIAWLGPIYSVITLSQDIFCVLIFVGVLWAFWRRYVQRVPRLQHKEKFESIDASLILVLIGIIVSSLFVLNAAREPVGHEFDWAVRPLASLLTPAFSDPESATTIFNAAWWVHIVTILGFMNYLPYSKHLHVMTSIPNVYFGSLSTVNKLEKIDFEDESLEQYGVADVQDFTWKQLLDGMTCTHCGRCTSVCPANITGKVLDPQQIIIQMHERTNDLAPDLISMAESGGNGNGNGTVESGEVEGGSASRTLIGDFVNPEALWQCTTCMACVQECPVMIEHVPAIVDMRRNLVMMEADFPPQAQGAFQNMETNFTPWAFSAAERADWAEDLDYVKTMADTSDEDREKLDCLFWVGCSGSYDDR